MQSEMQAVTISEVVVLLEYQNDHVGIDRAGYNDVYEDH